MASSARTTGIGLTLEEVDQFRAALKAAGVDSKDNKGGGADYAADGCRNWWG